MLYEVITLVPLRKNHQTGEIEKLVYFEYKVKYSPKSSPKSSVKYISSSALSSGNWYKIKITESGIRITSYNVCYTKLLRLDSSGRPLYIRGFNKEIGEAPINEVLAAGIILLSGWNKQDLFYDPMCGSGTFLTEAYMIACNIPATLHRA